MEPCVIVEIEKSPIPIIWLDTSLVIRLTKKYLGESLSKIDQERYDKLYDLLYLKVREEKLICPKADQVEEIELGRRLRNESLDVQTDLSLGVWLRHRQSIEDLQMQKAMKAFIKDTAKISISYKDAFYHNPIKEIAETKKRRVIITARSEGPSSEEIDRSNNTKQSLLNQIEELRRSNITAGITFEKQLEHEYCGYIEACRMIVSDTIAKIEMQGNLNVEDFSKLTNLIGYPLGLWKDMGGQPADLPGCLEFLKSYHYNAMPVANISAQLWADILTGNSPVKSGDLMDISQLSAVIPYCDFVIADKNMKNRLVRLNIDKKYQTKIFCMRDFEMILEIIREL